LWESGDNHPYSFQKYGIGERFLSYPAKNPFNPRKAIELFTQAIELKPDFNSLMKRGDAYFKIREYLSALRDYRDGNRLERQQPDPNSKISICSFNLVKE